MCTRTDRSKYTSVCLYVAYSTGRGGGGRFYANRRNHGNAADGESVTIESAPRRLHNTPRNPPSSSPRKPSSFQNKKWTLVPPPLLLSAVRRDFSQRWKGFAPLRQTRAETIYNAR